MENIDYKKKVKICEYLGANKFQKLVFKTEELKYKIIKKFFPKYIEWCDKLYDRSRDKELQKATTPEQHKRIIDYYRKQKMIMRKEFHREQNRNYHMDENKPTEILHYLNWNKEVHKRGMIKNIATISALAIPIGLGIAPILTIPLAVLELGSLFINFQCVNIQNCNIYKYKQCEEALKKREQRKTKKNIEQYGEAGAVISRTMDKTQEIPTMTQIIESIETKEELEQLKKLVQETLDTTQKTKEPVEKKIGGNK